jgi:hypothetical protein
MGSEDHIEGLDKEDRPHGKMLQIPVRDAVGSRSLAELKAPNSCLKIVGVGQMWFAGKGSVSAASAPRQLSQ